MDLIIEKKIDLTAYDADRAWLAKNPEGYIRMYFHPHADHIEQRRFTGDEGFDDAGWVEIRTPARLEESTLSFGLAPEPEVRINLRWTE